MTDPFSVAAGGVGIISLGLTVCQGIVNYYKSWSGQTEELRSILANVEHAAKLLGLLQRSLGTIPPIHAAGVEQVENCIIQAADAFERLDAVLQKCVRVSPSSVRRRSKNALRSMLYPFRKATIQKMSTAIGDVGRILQLAIHLLNLDLTMEQSRDLTAILAQIERQEHRISAVSISISRTNVHLDSMARALTDVKARYENLDRHCKKALSRMEDRFSVTDRKVENLCTTVRLLAQRSPPTHGGHDPFSTELQQLARVEQSMSAIQQGHGLLATQLCQVLWMLDGRPNILRQAYDRAVNCTQQVVSRIQGVSSLNQDFLAFATGFWVLKEGRLSLMHHPSSKNRHISRISVNLQLIYMPIAYVAVFSVMAGAVNVLDTTIQARFPQYEYSCINILDTTIQASLPQYSFVNMPC